MMTRKDYRILAAALRDEMAKAAMRTDADEMRRLESVVRELCSTLAEDNPRFDEARFRSACNPFGTGEVN